MQVSDRSLVPRHGWRPMMEKRGRPTSAAADSRLAGRQTRCRTRWRHRRRAHRPAGAALLGLWLGLFQWLAVSAQHPRAATQTPCAMNGMRLKTATQRNPIRCCCACRKRVLISPAGLPILTRESCLFGLATVWADISTDVRAFSVGPPVDAPPPSYPASSPASQPPVLFRHHCHPLLPSAHRLCAPSCESLAQRRPAIW